MAGTITSEQKDAALDKIEQIKEVVEHPDTDDIKWIRLQVTRMYLELDEILKG